MTLESIERDRETAFLQAISHLIWRMDDNAYVLYVNNREPQFHVIRRLPETLQEVLIDLEKPYQVESLGGGGIPGLHRITMSAEMATRLGIVPCVESEETRLYVSQLEREREQREPEGRS